MGDVILGKYGKLRHMWREEKRREIESGDARMA